MLEIKELECLQEIINEEILSYLDSGYNIKDEYVKIKMYSIKIGTKTIFYKWQDNFTFSANIEQIVYYIKLITGGKEK